MRMKKKIKMYFHIVYGGGRKIYGGVEETV